jgi:murein DD-endopeptidase MepM/ murein hydrolase activator NlpD
VKRAGLLLAVLSLLGGLAAPAGAAAPTPDQRSQEIANEVARLRQQVGEAADQESGIIAELAVSRKARKSLDAKVASLDAAIALAESEVTTVNAELDTAIAAELAATSAVTDAQDELKGSRTVLRDQAVTAFINFGTRPSHDEMLLRVENVNDAPRAAAYVNAVAERQAAVVAHLHQVQVDTAALEASAAEAQRGVAARQQDATSRKAALEQARAEQAQARADVASETANEQRLLDQVKSRRSDYENRINELQRESNNIAAQLRRRQSGQATTPGGHGVLAYPVANPVITSTFGYRIHPIYGDLRLHAGIDLAAGTGTPVYAAGAGTVIFAGWMSGYGNAVIIDHGGSLATLYGHNSALAVKVGDAVRRGTHIAAAGSTGNSTGPHVHFEVRVQGTPVDPMKYL